MSNYDLYVCTKSRRVKYPRHLHVPSVEAAHEIALRLARIFVEGRSSWQDLAIGAHDDFTVEAVSEAGQTVLAVPGKWMWAHLVQAHTETARNPLRTES
jgi:hypothetical protein